MGTTRRGGIAMKERSKQVFVFNLDGTLYKEFPSQKDAAEHLCTSNSNMGVAVKENRAILGKYVVSHSSVFPGFEEKLHGACIPCWAWNTDLQLVGNYPSTRAASNALGIKIHTIQNSSEKGQIADGKYIFTRSPEPPTLTHKQLVMLGKKPKVVYQPKPNPDKYQVSNAVWVKVDSFRDMEDAASCMGVMPGRARLLLKKRLVYNKTYRIRMVNRKFLVEKRGWEAVGNYKTLMEVCKVVKAALTQVHASLGKDAVIGGKYKVSRISQPIPETVV